jgi:hypothetical protein
VQPPIFRPRRRPAWPRWSIALSLAGLLGAAAVAAVIWHGARTSLVVRGLSLAVAPSEGRCPRADYTFTAVITTNGSAGRIRLRWTEPDGTRSGIVTTTVKPGAAVTTARLAFTITGTTAVNRSARVTVLEPTERTATVTIRYTC